MKITIIVVSRIISVDIKTNKYNNYNGNKHKDNKDSALKSTACNETHHLLESFS